MCVWVCVCLSASTLFLSVHPRQADVLELVEEGWKKVLPLCLSTFFSWGEWGLWVCVCVWSQSNPVNLNTSSWRERRQSTRKHLTWVALRTLKLCWTCTSSICHWILWTRLIWFSLVFPQGWGLFLSVFSASNQILISLLKERHVLMHNQWLGCD